LRGFSPAPSALGLPFLASDIIFFLVSSLRVLPLLASLL